MDPVALITLKKYWNFDNFRPPQDEIIRCVLEKKDTIALLPTGGGKSLCYQLPALLFEGKTIVITPLIALMEDQVSSLKIKGIPAQSVHSNLSLRQIDIILDNFVFGDTKILYISPERIGSEVFIERFKRTKIDLVAVDEAHCISQWGYDFRPAYLEIIRLREWNKNFSFIALTATATKEVLKDIIEKLEIKEPFVFSKSYQRNNISFLAIETHDKRTELLNIVTRIKASGILYVRNRGETMELSEWLTSRNIKTLPYHGGMDKDKRSSHQADWMNNTVQWMASTNAFGMGIDKSDVRMIIHLDIPSSIEEYYQEAGRAGRDGKESWAVVLFDFSDIAIAEKKLKEQFPEVELISEVYDQLCRYCQVAYGSGVNEQYDFQIRDFAIFVHLPVKKVFYILQILEKEGWLFMSEGLHDPTKIQFVCNHTDLFEPGFLSENEEKIVVHLLRRYEGLFSNPVKIDEDSIASELGISIQQTTDLLLNLEKTGIIKVSFRKSGSVLTFIRERPQKSQFFIDKKGYETRKNKAYKRLEAMLRYVQSEDECKQKMILEYFGESSEECGKCDYCRFKKEPWNQNEIISEIFLFLKQAVNKYELLTVRNIVFSFPYNKRILVKKALYLMESEKKIFIDNKGNITLNANEK